MLNKMKNEILKPVPVKILIRGKFIKLENSMAFLYFYY